MEGRAGNPRVQRRFRLIALAVSLLVALLLGEVAVRAMRLVRSFGPADRFTGFMVLYRADTELSYVPRGSVTVDAPDEAGQSVRIRTDENGVRIDTTAAVNKDEPAVAVVGDS